jgi:hypothetical protein
MENQQMAMPAGMPPEMASSAMGPDQMAIFDQMRQQISPQEFTSEMLAGGAQVDPQAVAEFTQALEGLNMPPEVLDALNDMVDALLAEPEKYAEMRQEFIKEGVPEDFLPEQFDPGFFAALNMAVDQMIGEPSGVQAFAKGGIAELKPIAKAIASYGRNGDTMLAHITPAEARMLRRRGGSGTINPHTGLPEFFLKKLAKAVGKVFKAVGNAVKSVVKGVVNTVKKFAQSTVGKIITTVALGFFVGPAAASLLGVGAGTAAGMAISGFVGGAGSTLLAGGSLKDALKAGAVGGLTAGAYGAFTGAPLTGAATMTPGQAFQGQVDKFTNMFTPSAAPTGIDATAAEGSLAKATTPSDAMGQATQAAAPPEILTPNTVSASPASMAPDNIDMGGAQNFAAQAPTAGPQFSGYPAQNAAPVNPYDPATATRAIDYQKFGTDAPNLPKPGSYLADAKNYLNETFNPVARQAAGQPAALEAGSKAVNTLLQTNPNASQAVQDMVFKKAFEAATPGILSTYGPAVGLGIGALGMAGGFQAKPINRDEVPLIGVMEDRLAKESEMMKTDPGMFSPQGFEKFGATYNDKGQITSWAPWTPESAGAFAKPTVVEQTSPSYTVGGGGYLPAPMTNMPGVPIPQPYNTYSMYGNVLPPPQYASSRPPMRRASGGIANLAAGGYPRRSGQIEGPGTETSDDIPAMLSDGEFVMTAKAVRGAGGGSRRDGAKKMYALMHRLEKNATRG